MIEFAKSEFDLHSKVLKNFYSQISEISKISYQFIKALEDGNKILIFGNGGSAADAQHFAAELVGRYESNRKALNAVSLTTDSSSITSIGNDFSFDDIFKRQVSGLANKGDIALGISTSGNSKNVINGLLEARKKGCSLIAFTGEGGGYIKEICDTTLQVPSNKTPRIQEMHILTIHIICGIIDNHFK